MAHHTGTAIKKINDYEKKWKIQTSTNKFKIIPMAKRKLEPIIIEGDHYEYAAEGKLLGLKITTTGYKSCITEKRAILNSRLTKLKRFKRLKPSNKKKLYTALIKSALLYPAVPLNALSKTSINKLQVIQNKALRFVYNEHYPSRKTNKELHKQANLQAINTELYNRSKATWEKIEDLNLEIEEGWITDNTIPNTTREHRWFPSSKKRVEAPPPEPKYKN